MKRKALSKMAGTMTPMPSSEISDWKKDSNLLNWLKSFRLTILIYGKKSDGWYEVFKVQ
jgi:hypothetical protein